MADLAKIKDNTKETLVVELKFSGETILNEPVGKAKGTPMTITANGPSSKAAIEVGFDLQDLAIAEYKANPDKAGDINSRKMFELRVERVAQNTTAWDITLGGEKPEFTVEAAKVFYKDYPMFFAQVEEALELESGFTLA